MHTFDPIIACATNLEKRAALAIIRLSGFKNLEKFAEFFSIKVTKIRPRIATLVDIVDGEELLDSALVTYFEAPKSYTGENVLEISTHGNPLIVDKIINLFVTKKLCRPAVAGEFTSRAFKNKKLTLNQVEGLELLLNAKNQLMCRQGLRALNGDLAKEYDQLFSNFLNIKMAVELSIDFLEDVGEEAADANLKKYIKVFFKNLTALYERANFLKCSFSIPQIVLVGETNAGKSSLFNNILAKNRSIVSSENGTTRDYVSEIVTIGGADFQLIDTAGIRESSSVIEIEGISRSRALIVSAYYKILVLNPTVEIDRNNKIYSDTYDLVVFTHADLPDFKAKVINIAMQIFAKRKIYLSNVGPIEPAMEEKSGSIGPAFLPIDHEFFGPIEPATNLVRIIKDAIFEKYEADVEKNPIIIKRHQEIINNIYQLSIHFLKEKELLLSDISIVASNLALIEREISNLIGIITVDDLLTSIFSNFCIGK